MPGKQESRDDLNIGTREHMNVEFWGTRGSIPTPERLYMKYGGNTPCLEVTLQDDDEHILILDAGTGIRQLGLDLMKRPDRIRIYLCVTHFHWDHLQGIPFFAPLYSERCECTFVGCDPIDGTFEDILYASVHPPYFPVGFEEFKARVDFMNQCQGEFDIGKYRIGVNRINHPGGAVAYRIRADQRTIVYMTDNEIASSQSETDLYQDCIEFCRGTDLLVHDAQYTPEEYMDKKGWGHSSFEEAVHFAIDCGAKKLALFHHDPEHDDEVIDDMLERSHHILSQRGSPLECCGAREGLKLTV
jgi:phosphoribosyl 1,2-cyclic phosphodiesterase